VKHHAGFKIGAARSILPSDFERRVSPGKMRVFGTGEMAVCRAYVRPRIPRIRIVVRHLSTTSLGATSKTHGVQYRNLAVFTYEGTAQLHANHRHV
jgi:hypothetical protein